MNIQTDVPLSLSDVDAAWLTKVLREEGVLHHEEVVKVTTKVIGEGVGFMGEVALLNLEYSQGNSPAPKSMILKIPSSLVNRKLGQLMGVYEREIRFYTGLQKSLNIRSPRHYYSALDTVDDPAVILARVRFLNRMPLWVIAIFSLLMFWLIGFMPRRYVLLIEDMGHYRMADQVTGCSFADARIALDCMAKMHSQYWNSDELEELNWVLPLEEGAKLGQLVYLQALKQFKKANRDWLTEQHLATLDWLKANAVELIVKLAEPPCTLLHGDFRLDNLCFDDETNEVILFDWQTVMRGPVGLELAYFLSASLTTEASEAEINDLIEHYRQALNRHGVEISVSRLRWEYDTGMLVMLHRIAPVFFQNLLEIGEGRGQDLMKTWIERIFKKTEQVALDKILVDIPA